MRDPVAAGLFGLIQGLVGLIHKGGCVSGSGPAVPTPKLAVTLRCGQGRPAMAEANALGHLDGFVFSGRRQQNDEFFTAVAGDDVMMSERRF